MVVVVVVVAVAVDVVVMLVVVVLLLLLLLHHLHYVSTLIGVLQSPSVTGTPQPHPWLSVP